jgi:DNA repair exonuclease SbcCD ATPase subunit
MKQRFSLPTYPTHSFLSLVVGQRESSSGLPRGLLAACVATALSASLLVGCGDPKLAEQAKFEKEFNTVASSYESAVRGNTALLSSNPSSESVAALRALAEQAKALSGGTAAQQEAATQLAASMYRTAGSIELARVSRIEAEQEIARSVAFNASLLAADLDAIGAAAEALDYSNATAVPEAMKSATTNATRTLQEEVRTLERPLGQLVAEISSRTAELARLESEAAVSMRRARESSAKIAEDYVNEAARIQEEARGVRNTLAEKTIEADALKTTTKTAVPLKFGQRHTTGRVSGVAIQPGATALTRTPCGAQAIARLLVSCAMPPFEAL